MQNGGTEGAPRGDGPSLKKYKKNTKLLNFVSMKPSLKVACVLGWAREETDLGALLPAFQPDTIRQRAGLCTVALETSLS